MCCAAVTPPSFACAFIELTRTHFSTVLNIRHSIWTNTLRVNGNCGESSEAVSLNVAEAELEEHLEERLARKRKRKRKVESISHWSAFREQRLLFNLEFDTKCSHFRSSAGETYGQKIQEHHFRRKTRCKMLMKKLH